MSEMTVTAVSVDALSYSGTTWLNLVLGSHDKAFTLGPPHRVWRLKDQGFKDANLVWGAKDTFWKGFDHAWDRSENFLTALCRYRGSTHVIFDNPGADFRDKVILQPGVTEKRMWYLRDARAITASFARKNPDKTYLETILPSGWFYPSFMQISLPKDRSTHPVYYYEKCLADPLAFLADIGPYLGLEYSEKSLRFWEWDHHITSGNQGSIALVKMAKGLDVGNFKDRDFYAERLEALKKDPITGFADNRWESQLGRLDRFYFDVLMGAKHAELGYERDKFSDDEVRDLLQLHKSRVSKSESIDLPAKILSQYLAARKAPAIRARVNADNSGPATRIRQTTSYLGSALQRLRTGDYERRPAEQLVKHFAKRLRKSLTPPNASPAIAEVETVARKLPDGVPPTGLHYLPEVTPGIRSYFKPYAVKPSGLTLQQVLKPAHWNIYHAHGPAYDNKSAYRIVFDSPCRYRELLEGALAIPGTRFMTARDMIHYQPAADEIICHVRHDVDADIYAARQQARIEASLGIQTTYYVLHTAPYWGHWNGQQFERHEAMAEIYREIQDLGHEVSLHTDGLGLYQFQQTEGAEGLKAELAWLKSQGIHVDGSVTHNSFGVYGAENFAIFKDRPLALNKPGGPKVVVNEGRIALLQQLDEAELGLAYEGNDFFTQKEVPIQYYALRGMNDWRYQAYNPSKMQSRAGASSTNPTWFSQEDVVDHLADSPKGLYAMFIVHPEYYGMRADDKTHAVEACDAPAKITSNPIGWCGFEPGATSQRHFAEGRGQSRQSVVKVNALGFADVPPDYIRDLDERYVFLGKGQIATDALSVENKLPHALVRVLRRVEQRSAGATSLAGSLAPLAVRLAWFDKVVETNSFTHAVLSVGLSDVISENPERLAHLYSLDTGAARALVPDDFSAAAIAMVHGIKPGGQRAEAPRLSLQAYLDEFAEAGTARHAANRIKNAVTYLKSKNIHVTLLLEDCGEELGLRFDRLSIDEKARLVHVLNEHFGHAAEQCGTPFVNPYQAFVNYGGLAKTHWDSDGNWSIHGHTLAARTLARSLAKPPAT